MEMAGRGLRRCRPQLIAMPVGLTVWRYIGLRFHTPIINGQSAE